MPDSEKEKSAGSREGEYWGVYLYRLAKTCLRRKFFIFRRNINRPGHGGVFSFFVSLLLHMLVLAFLLFLQYNISIGGSGGGGGFIQVASGGKFVPGKPGKPEKAAVPEEGKDENSDEGSQKKEADTPDDNQQPGTGGSGISQGAYSNAGGFGGVGADTSGLEQVYHENTRNVTLKYPLGWSFLDQNVKSRLDGVTFWFSAGNINPPPYIHLEVKEKYLFNEKSFKYNSKQEDCVYYYNDPEEMAGQVSQLIYVRTEDSEDYSIKLIISGGDAFKGFQPTFYGIIKSFKFGKQWF